MGSKSSSLKINSDFSQQELLKMRTIIKIAKPANVQQTNTIEAVLSILSY